MAGLGYFCNFSVLNSVGGQILYHLTKFAFVIVWLLIHVPVSAGKRFCLCLCCFCANIVFNSFKCWFRKKHFLKPCERKLCSANNVECVWSDFNTNSWCFQLVPLGDPTQVIHHFLYSENTGTTNLRTILSKTTTTLRLRKNTNSTNYLSQ